MGDVIYTDREISEPDGDAQTWSRGGRITTMKADGIYYKDAVSFKTVERAYQCLDNWRALGWSGAPSSPASVFGKAFGEAVDAGIAPHPKSAQPAGLEFRTKGAVWLWIESAVPRGAVASPVWHYDMNQAFWSATKRGLPSRFRPYTPSRGEWIGAVRIKSASLPMPWFWENRMQTDSVAWVTSKDVDLWGMDIELLDGVSYDDTDVDLTPVMRIVEEHFSPWVAKRARQQAWGAFVSDSPVIGRTIKEGKEQKRWEMASRWRCPLWSIIITRRIMRKVMRAWLIGDAVSCFVDSVLCRNELPKEGGHAAHHVGTEPGTWRLEKQFHKGVYIVAPGIFDGLPRSTRHVSDAWYRHAGVRRGGGMARPGLDHTDQKKLGMVEMLHQKEKQQRIYAIEQQQREAREAERLSFDFGSNAGAPF